MIRPKAIVRYVLERLVNRQRFNDSALYRLYVNICYPAHARRKKAEQRFYRKALDGLGASVVFDIGANGGQKAAVFLPLAEKIVCVEPSPAAVKLLKRRFAHNRNVVILEKGVGAEEATANFHMFGDGDCYNTFSSKWAAALASSSTEVADRPVKTIQANVDVAITTLDQLIGQYGIPGYIKIDVEGYEVNVLKGLSTVVPLISFECNLPEFCSETIECLSILATRCPSARFNYCVTEPPAAFESEQWLRHEEMSRIVEHGIGAHRFMEIYCKCAVPSSTADARAPQSS